VRPVANQRVGIHRPKGDRHRRTANLDRPGGLSSCVEPALNKRAPMPVHGATSPLAVPMLGKMDCFGLTDIGRRRTTNEDQFLIADLAKSVRVHSTSLNHDDQTRIFGESQGKLLLVADGMGGHLAGDRASAVAVDELLNYVLNSMRWFFRLTDDPDGDFLEDLKAALVHCETRIWDEMQQFPQRRGMGTTLTMACIIWPRLYVVHAGDSRCYLFRDPRFKQITTDHTVAQKMVDKGELDADDVETSDWSHVLWNVLGGDLEEIHPSVYRAELRLGDILLLCTDGLTKHVSDEAVCEMLAESSCAERACNNLVSAANESGGADNVTVVVARFCDADDAERAMREEAVVRKAGVRQAEPAVP
jgi:protein phosphatase